METDDFHKKLIRKNKAKKTLVGVLGGLLAMVVKWTIFLSASAVVLGVLGWGTMLVFDFLRGTQ